MERTGKVLSALIVAVAIAFASTGALAQNVFWGTISDDWHDPDNWSSAVVPSGEGTHVGSSAAPGVSATVYSGNTAETGSLRLGYEEDGSLTVQSGATLLGLGGLYLGAHDGDASGNVGTLVVEGFVNHWSGGNFNIGYGSDAMVTIAPGGTIETWGWSVIGRNYSGSKPGIRNITINQLGGLFHSHFSSSTAVEFYSDATHTNIYKMSGGTINLPDGGWRNFGGTFEVAGSVEVNAGQGMGFRPGSDGGVTLKFSGTDPLYTSSTNVSFRGLDPNDPNSVLILTYVDVSELTLSTPNTWVTVMNAGNIANDVGAVLAPGTDANVWSMQVVKFMIPDPNDANVDIVEHAELQLMETSTARIMGDVNLSGSVNDDDLSLLLANWVIGDEWGEGDLNESGAVNDDDLSLLLANWGAGGSAAPEAVPEPASVALLLPAVLALIRRRRKK